MENPEKDEFYGLCAAIGLIVLNWGIAEHMLDGCVKIVFDNYGGNKVEEDLPRMLGRKTDFLRKCAKLPQLAKFKQTTTDIIDKFDSLAEQRHNLIHGAITSLTPQNGRFEFRKFDIKKQQITVHHSHLDHVSFDILVGEILDLGGKTGDLGLALSNS